MRSKTIRALALAAALPFIQTLSAELPMLEKPWLGFFAVSDNSKYFFQTTATGEAGIFVINKDGAPIEVSPITLP